MDKMESIINKFFSLLLKLSLILWGPDVNEYNTIFNLTCK
jgi:hypothetical protein